jgi:hypothetical protein
MLAEIVRSRTNQASDILDEQKIQLLKIHVANGVLYHPGLKVTGSARDDLDDGNIEHTYALRVPIGFNIAFNDAQAVLFAQQQWDGPLEKACFP